MYAFGRISYEACSIFLRITSDESLQSLPNKNSSCWRARVAAKHAEGGNKSLKGGTNGSKNECTYPAPGLELMNSSPLGQFA
jgi:hypothetical protein